jgi:host factor-I protein
MEKTGSQNIQDAFLNTLRREKAVVTIHLLHGTTLSGRLKSFDKFSVMLDTNGQDFLIFKHAIATVTSTMPPQRRPQIEGEQQQRPPGSFVPPQQSNRQSNE